MAYTDLASSETTIGTPWTSKGSVGYVLQEQLTMRKPRLIPFDQKQKRIVGSKQGFVMLKLKKKSELLH